MPNLLLYRKRKEILSSRLGVYCESKVSFVYRRIRLLFPTPVLPNTDIWNSLMSVRDDEPLAMC